MYGRAFWSRGYCVSTVGLDEDLIKNYIHDQDKFERDGERGLFDLDKNQLDSIAPFIFLGAFLKLPALPVVNDSRRCT